MVNYYQNSLILMKNGNLALLGWWDSSYDWNLTIQCWIWLWIIFGSLNHLCLSLAKLLPKIYLSLDFGAEASKRSKQFKKIHRNLLYFEKAILRYIMHTNKVKVKLVWQKTSPHDGLFSLIMCEILISKKLIEWPLPYY